MRSPSTENTALASARSFSISAPSAASRPSISLAFSSASSLSLPDSLMSFWMPAVRERKKGPAFFPMR